MMNDESKLLIVLLKRLKNGDNDAFTEFYELTKYKVYYSLMALTKKHELTEDIMAETYLKFLENIKSVKDNKNPLGYLLIIARNQALDYFKKENRVDYLEDFVNEDSIGASSVDHYNDSDALHKEIQKVLNADEYEIVVLYILSELTHKEIAKQLNKPLGTITWAYNNAIRKLQKGLKNYETN